MGCLPAPESGAKSGFRCDGCPSNIYSAPGGQYSRPEPHSFCGALDRPIPMVLGEHQQWLSSSLPEDCPRKCQSELPGSSRAAPRRITKSMREWCGLLRDPKVCTLERMPVGGRVAVRGTATVYPPSQVILRQLKDAGLITWEEQAQGSMRTRRAVLTAAGVAVAQPAAATQAAA